MDFIVTWYQHHAETLSFTIRQLQVDLSRSMGQGLLYALGIYVGVWIGLLVSRRRYAAAGIWLAVGGIVPPLLVELYRPTAPFGGLVIVATITWIVTRVDLDIRYLPPEQRGTKTLRQAVPLLLVALGAACVVFGLIPLLLKTPSGSPETRWQQLALQAALYVVIPACALLGGVLGNWATWRQAIVAALLIGGFVSLSLELAMDRLVKSDELATVLDAFLILVILLTQLRFCGYRAVIDRPERPRMEPEKPKSPFED